MGSAIAGSEQLRSVGLRRKNHARRSSCVRGRAAAARGRSGSNGAFASQQRQGWAAPARARGESRQLGERLDANDVIRQLRQSGKSGHSQLSGS
jgi:hypothetical protein